jgi:hypothetical protein
MTLDIEGARGCAANRIAFAAAAVAAVENGPKVVTTGGWKVGPEVPEFAIKLHITL